MTYCKHMILAALVSGSAAAHAEPRFAADVTAGMRQAGLLAAPTEQQQNLAEMTAAARVIAPTELPVELSGGVFGAMQSMGNSLGDGMESFSGYQVGPELRVAKAFGGLVPFARLRYAFGRYSGEGAENWGDQPEAAFFLFDAEESTTKNFVSRGTHVALGAAYAVTKAISVSGELDLGYEMIRTDARVIENDREFTDKDVTAYRSQALLVGAGYTL
jgi:hypothetical protein